MEASIIIAIVACILAIISAIYSILMHRWVTELQYRVRRPHTASPWLMEEGKSVRIFPQNIGGEVATNFNVVTRYPNTAKITSLDSGGFIVEKGGLNSYFVVLQKGRVYPGAWLKPISIKAMDNDGKEAIPTEIFSWCQEESGLVSLPPELP